nr:hypothetical protein [uncultured Capnocytophaga sp.]
MTYIHKKDVFGKLFRGLTVDIGTEKIDKDFLMSNHINSLVIRMSTNEEMNKLDDLSNLPFLEGLSFPDVYYPTLDVLKKLSHIIYLKIQGKSGTLIPFDFLPKLWCVYLNYDKKTCTSIFKAQQLEYLFIDNYVGKSSEDFVVFNKLKRLGLMKFKLSEFNAIENMSNIEHLGMGYNSKMTDISWIKKAPTLKSVAISNCSKITNWEMLGNLSNLETIIIEISSIDFLSNLPNLKEVRFIGKTYVKDNRIKHLLNNNLQRFFIPIRNSYDITINDLF